MMRTKEQILVELEQDNLPNKVPAYPSKGTSKYLYVEIIKSKNVDFDEHRVWYREGEIYKVLNKFYWGFYGNGPHFTPKLNGKGGPTYGISLDHCKVLSPGTVLTKPEPEYTLEEIAEKLGHSFKLKINVNGTTKNRTTGL